MSISTLSIDSGIYIDPETFINDTSIEYFFIRSILMTPMGTVNENFISELFNGLLELEEDNIIEYYAHPSTIILNNSNVIIASQIFEREYTNKQQFYNNILFFNQYYTIRNSLLTNSSSRNLTWLGSPSLVYSYKNRIILKKYFQENPAINMFFWPTSFNSSKCIRDFNNNNEYCDKYTELKNFCKKSIYQQHNTYLDLSQGHTTTRTPYNFITNFQDAIQRIISEEEEIYRYNQINKTKYYQRYNETFTYFFPWDVIGFEIGNINTSTLIPLLDLFIRHRINAIDNLLNIIKYKFLIAKINLMISIILMKDGSLIKLFLEENNFSYTFFLLSKYILLSKCGSSLNRYLENDEIQNIKHLITDIIHILRTPLILYEYKLLWQTNKFILQEIGRYSNENVLSGRLNRNSQFTLFEQIQDKKTKITHVYKSSLQLMNEDIIEHMPSTTKMYSKKRSKTTLRTRQSKNSKNNTTVRNNSI